MHVKIFYWKDSKYLLGGVTDTREQYEQDYLLVFEYKAPKGLTQMTVCEDAFVRLNSEKNPLSSRQKQKWLGRDLRPNPHTSMSVGDIVHFDGYEPVICASFGWEKLPFSIRQPGSDDPESRS